MTNRSIGEISPYLLQHAQNLVDWYAWGDEAFEKGHVDEKPIFLSVGYSSCHWCHVMERESFENAEVEELADAQDLRSVCRDRRGADTYVFCWRFGPLRFGWRWVLLGGDLTLFGYTV